MSLTDDQSSVTLAGNTLASRAAGITRTIISPFSAAPIRSGPPERERFDVWAPRAHRLRLFIAGPDGDHALPMVCGRDGWWTLDVPAPLGQVDYGYLLDDDSRPLPDPRSRLQPDGVHGLSRTVDAASFAWTDEAWTGRYLPGSVIYELHVGTFTSEGTLDAAISRLDHLVELGVDMVELMPVNAFNGEHGWGYDGVLWHSVHAPYGGPEAYMRFVNACHEMGLGVVQDVVHNHFGPSGNYLPRFGPYLKSGRNTWGDLVNLDAEGSAEVRQYILDSVKMFFVDYHVDALRLDAVHALADDAETHLLEELSTEVIGLSAHLGKPLALIAESDLNDPRLITPREGGGYGLDAQWDDDFHHALRVALTGQTDGYYADFAPLWALAKVCMRGFFHDGTHSSFRDRLHGVPVDVERMPAYRLVVYSRNHDQIGNRARGERLSEHLDADQLACAALITLTSPFTPMLFQGEEWAATTPFQFFTSHPEPELGEAVARGRVAEFARMGWDPSVIPNPQDPATFQRSKLDWSQADSPDGAQMLEIYRSLLRLRRELPELTDPDLRKVNCWVDEEARLFEMRRGGVAIAVNFGDDPVEIGPYPPELGLVFTTVSPARLVDGQLTLPPHAGAILA